MSAKFMAFENEASTSQQAHYYANDYDEGQDERIEMNVNQYPNYQSHEPYQANNHHSDVSAFGASPYGVVDEEEEENDLTDDLQEKEQKNVGYRKFMHNNAEQFKPIVGGLILLLGSGIHIVWGIYHVFNLYEKRETTEMHSMKSRCIIWSWYCGAIIGSICAGFALQRIRKNRIYLVAAAILIKSGILLLVSDGETNYCLFFSRLSGGCTHGLVYVTILVHASENATKEFREFLILIIGALLNYSLLISVLCFFYTDGLLSSRYANCMGLIAYGICSIIIVAKHSTETVPFLLQNNGTEMDGLETVAKLKKKPIAARSVHHDYLTMRKVVNDELIYYGPPAFGSVFLIENRKSLVFCIFGRLCSVLSFNLPLIVMILLFLRNWIDESVPMTSHHLNKTNVDGVTTMPPTSLEHMNVEEKIAKMDDRQNADAYMGNAYHHHNAVKPKRDKRESNNANTPEHHREHEPDRGKEENGAPGSGPEKSESKSEKAEEASEREVDKGKADKKPEPETKPEVKPKPEKEESKHEKEKEGEHDESKANTHNKHEKEKDEKEKDEKEREKIAKETKLVEEKVKAKHEKSNVPARAIENSAIPDKSHDDKEHGTAGERVIEYTAYTHLLIFLHRRELTLVLIAWFIFGTLTVAFLYTLNLKRFVYHVACVLCSVLVVSGVAHSFHWMTGIMHFALIIYFNYITIPIDLFGHGMLAEAFPITLKAYSIAIVTSFEHFIHIIIIGLYMTEWFHDSVVIFMLAVAYLSHEIASNLPQRSNLTLAEARDEYQKVNLLFIGQPARVNDRERI